MQFAPTSSLTINAAVDSLPRCTHFVCTFASSAGFPAKRIREIELVVEEIVANICRHGYREGSGTLQISCRKTDQQRLDVLFVDRGNPFNLLEMPLPELRVDLDEREVGGLGVPLVRGLVEQASYRREGDRNVLCLTIEAQRRSGGAEPK